MTTTACVQCHVDGCEGSFLCTTCTAQVKTWLLELAGHAADLSETVVARLTSRRGERVMVRGNSEKPLPYDDDAAEVAWILHNDLVAIVRDLCEQRGVEFGGVDTSASLSAWLAKHVESIALSPDALETFSTVEHVHGLVVRTVDVPAVRVLLGPCDGHVGTKPCGADLRATVGAKVAACSTCQTKHGVDEYQVRLLARMGASLMTAAELAGSVQFSGGPKADTIAKWKRRGRRMPSGFVFEAHGQTPEGADLFRVSDFLAMTAPAQAREAA